MYTSIKKSFIKGYGTKNISELRTAYGTVAGVFGIASNFVLFALKIAVGFLSGSISIIADAINNLSDAGASLVTILGFRLAKRPADSEHPFGHARYEYIAGLIVSFIVLLIGVLLAKSSIEKIFSPSKVNTDFYAVAVLVFAVLVKLWQAGLYVSFGKDINSTALIAAAEDSRNDVISTSAVFISVIVALIFPSVNIDGYIGAAVSLFIIISAFKLIKDTIDPLLGTVPDKELVDNINKKVLSYEGILGIHDLMVYNYGPSNCFATLHAEVDAKSDFLVCHDLIDNIERDVFECLGVWTVIHMDPVIIDDEDANALKIKIVSLLRQELGENISIHDFRVVRGNTHTNVLFDVVLPFEAKTPATEIANFLKSHMSDGVNYFFIVNIDNSYV